MKKNYAYYNNPKINSFKDLMNLSIKKPDDIAFKYLDKSKVLISKTYKDFYEDANVPISKGIKGFFQSILRFLNAK